MTQLVIPPNSQIAAYGIDASILATAGAMYQPAMASLAGGINRIGFKGNRFHLHIDGADLVHPQMHLDCIFLGASRENQRTWFAKGYDQAGDNDAPTCYSSTGIAPDAGIPATDRQGADCKSCPRNQENSGPGGRGKACGTSRRIVVMLPHGTQGGGRLLQAKVSGMSMFGDDYPQQNLLNFQGYMRQIGSLQQTNGIPPFTYLTQIHFDAQQSVPVTRFSVGDPAMQRPTELRAAAQADVEYAVSMLTSGEVSKLLDAPVASPKQSNAALPAPTQTAPVGYTPPAQTAPVGYTPPAQTVPTQPYTPPTQTAPVGYTPPVVPQPQGAVHMATGLGAVTGFDDL